MSIELEIMKAAARAKREEERWKNPVGQRFVVPREGRQGVDVFLYRPEDVEQPWPVIFNLHGGAWVGCDASQMDSYCLDMAKKCGAFIVNINYTKLDIEPFPYPQEEIRDTVLWFRDHAGEYSIDPERFALMGYSAGGHLAAASALMLKDGGFKVSAQVLCYPFLDFTSFSALGESAEGKVMCELFLPDGIKPEEPYISPGLAEERQMEGMAPVAFVVCGPDPLTEHAKAYQRRLAASGVQTSLQLYERALHGFLEVNHKEYPDQEAKSPDQEALAKEAEDYIAGTLKQIWEKKA